MNVVVVGAGLAGLACARRLVALELGGQWLGEGHTRMYELVDELGLSTFRTWNDKGRLLLELQGKQTRMKPHKGAVPRLSPIALADVGQGMLRFARLAARADVQRPWETPNAEVLDGQTWETWIRRNLRTKAGRAYFHVACEAVWAAEPGDMSLLHALFYTRSNADLETLLAVDRGAQQDRVVGGSVLVSEGMAAALGGRVLLGRPVRRIEHDDNGARVVGRDGSIHAGDAVVVTLPPTLAGRLEYDAPLPSTRDQLTQQMPAGSVIKVFGTYPEPFWREAGLNGQAAADSGPVKVTFDNSPPSGRPGVLMGFLEGREARVWTRQSPESRRSAVLDCFARYFGPRAAEPLQYLERDWMAEEFTRGCYGAHFGPGVWTSYGKAWREPVGRIHWAGTEYASEWNGYMEGAVRSGEATAEAVAKL